MLGLAQFAAAAKAKRETARIVPGYGPEKLKRVTKQLQRQYAELTDLRGDLRYLERKGLHQKDHIREVERQRNALGRAIGRLERLGQETFNLDRAKLLGGRGKELLSLNNHAIAKRLMRKHGLATLRHVYTLFHSP